LRVLSRLVIVVAAVGAVLAGVLAGVASVRASVPSGPHDVSDTTTHAGWRGDGAFAGGLYVSTDNGAQCFDSAGHPNPTTLSGPSACEVDTLYVDVPASFWTSHSGGVDVKIFDDNAATDDFDLYVYKRNSDGTRGAFVGSSGNGAGTGPPEEDFVISSASGSPNAATTCTLTDCGYYLAVVAFSTTGNYSATADFVLGPTIPNTPPIVKKPPGFRSFRASHDGFISHSEPNISMNPLNHANLVAGSKQYVNLKHYLFRIGMYSSFDGGQTWRDTGHLPVPSLPDSTPALCNYEPPPAFPAACTFLTSDIWTTFDDEGNVYAMALVSPVAATGTGWQMWAWKSSDGGVTWSNPVVIHDHIMRTLSSLFLDDKNAIAVDNYTQAGSGPVFTPNQPRDGHIGNLYACWELDGTVAPTQNVAFTRSEDGGATWQSGVATVISGVNQREIGCQIAVAPSGRVYVSFLVYSLTGPSLTTVSGVGQYLTWSDSHGDPGTFVPPIKVATVNPLPNHLQTVDKFRNLSLPAMAVSPRDGTVYVTWADERTHATGGGQDADILMVKGQDNGLGLPPGNPPAVFSSPMRVNQDALDNGKDQFQPQLAVTNNGQIDISYFDRRNDPNDFFIDTYLSRSNDCSGAATTCHWTDTRVTSAMSDPRINPPIDGAGNAFYGDYQGLVADDSCAIPFWNDTHLANLPLSNPNYSPWQEVFSARIPNGHATCPGG
jgi:hypothetical protein